uniref:ADAMTS-like 1 n=1 Tax=Periophthalmus magnuspinnatus TaxID=409849 RepID=A0A3B4B7Q5_9GOBI
AFFAQTAKIKRSVPPCDVMRICFILLFRFIPGPWEPCSKSCGAGVQHRAVKCQVLLSFSQTVADLPDDECEGDKPAETQPCYRTPCSGAEEQPEDDTEKAFEKEELHDWEYEGFTQCSESCGRGRTISVLSL